MIWTSRSVSVLTSFAPSILKVSALSTRLMKTLDLQVEKSVTADTEIELSSNSVKMHITVAVLGGPQSAYSGIIPVSVLRDHAWWCSGNHMWCQELKPGQSIWSSKQRKHPTHCIASPALRHSKSMSGTASSTSIPKMFVLPLTKTYIISTCSRPSCYLVKVRKKHLFYFCFGRKGYLGHPWQCSGITAGSALRNYSW